jgi:hypothetical protein
VECLVFVEGFIVFDEDMDDLGQEAMIREAHDRALNVINCIRSHLDDNRRGEILRSGIKPRYLGLRMLARAVYSIFLLGVMQPLHRPFRELRGTCSRLLWTLEVFLLF